MARGVRRARLDMGEALSFEDVLTVITVLLVLRMVFMVPLVNMDKAKTVSARRDNYWSQEAAWVLKHPGDSAQVYPYRSAFDLEGRQVVLTEDAVEGNVYLEAAAPDSNLLILKQYKASSRFIAMNIQGPGHAISFRRGKILWSEVEKEWFVASDSIDYGNHGSSKAMENEFRAWTKKVREY